MDEKSRKKVEKVLDEGNIGYAYLYPTEGSEVEQFVFSMKPENIANFLGSHYLDASKMILTDIADRLILDTFGGFINCCPDQKLCAEVVNRLAPIQMGDEEAQEFLMITRDEYDAYGRWEDEQVTMAEMSMG